MSAFPLFKKKKKKKNPSKINLIVTDSKASIKHTFHCYLVDESQNIKQERTKINIARM